MGYIDIRVDSGVGYIQEFNGTLYIGSKDKFEPMMEWIKDKIRLEIKNVGKRYAPLSDYNNLNIKIKYINKCIFSLTNIDLFYISNINKLLQNTKIQNYAKSLNINLDKLAELVSCIENDGNKKSDCFNNLVREIVRIKRIFEYEKNDLIEALSNERGITPYNASKKSLKKSLDNLKSIIESFVKIIEILRYEKKFISIFEKKILWVSGEALIGKTHLFCDIALNRLENNQPILLFFGNTFDGNQPIIANMIKQLGLAPISDDEFLEALNKWGSEYNTRTLIMIDAINETEKPKIWQEGIIKFCEQIKSYPNLALAMSVRDVEKNKIITDNNEKYIANKIVEVAHKGFEGIEIEAVRTFCEALGVEFPKVPLHTYRLFVNPGMLFLYIETINNTIKKVDNSIINPLAIFRSYLNNLESKFYQRYIDDVDEDDEIVLEAIREFIALGTSKDYVHFYLDYKEVKKQLKPLHNKVLEFLISEGALNKLKEENSTKVYFTYQKFENFFIAEYLLNDFAKNQNIISEIIEKHNSALTEALFMQIPQKLNKEPFEIYPDFLDDDSICELYLDSLVWRAPNSINEKTFEYIKYIRTKYNMDQRYFEVILQLSTVPNHPLNIIRLHQTLLSLELLQRDYVWSIAIHNSYINDRVVKRIIDWAWNKKEDFEIESESLYLYGLTLGWFLTSSNRELRDSATKALVNLFTNRVDVFARVLQEFESVDDLYILERFYAVGYGIVLRSDNQNGLQEVGEYIYNAIFNKDEVIEHILLRDYAKLTVEYIHKLLHLNIDTNRVLPPYGSKLPVSYPVYKDIEEYGHYRSASSSIIESMRTESMGWYGDFGRYTFQATLNQFDCSKLNFQDVSNYAVQVIFNEYIKDIELFEKAEKRLNAYSESRYDHKMERIGKKYQWLSMFKILAIIADNYKIKDRKFWMDKNFESYKGTYQLSVRDIDPTTILKSKSCQEEKWWLNLKSDFECNNLSDIEWMKTTEKLPKLSDLIQLKNQELDYLLLSMNFSIDGSKDKEKYRNLYYHISSFVIKKDELHSFLQWVESVDIYGADAMPKSYDIQSTYLREYPKSNAYQYIDNYYFGQPDWDDTFAHEEGVMPCKMLLTSTTYRKETGNYDKSVQESIEIALPNKWFVNQMGLKQTLKDGEWVNEKNEVVFFDPTVNSCLSKSYESEVLVANKKLLIEFLEANGYTMIWIMWGEKQVRNRELIFNNKDFLGIAEISGYGYFDGDGFIENKTLKYEKA